VSKMLVGIKSRIEPFRAWLLSWGSDSPPDTNPLALCGPSGTGKTSIVLTFTPEYGYHPEIYSGTGLDSFLDMVRLPTMLGRRRLAVIDDAGSLSKKEWKTIENEVKAKQIPIVLIVQDPKEIPWSTRAKTLRVELALPTPIQLFKSLKLIRDEQNLPHSDFDLKSISEHSPTWRQAALTLATTPPGTDLERLPKPVGSRTGFSPVGLLASVEFNNADPEVVGDGVILHSHGWEIPGMSQLVIDYLRTIQTQSQDKVPYRYRPLRGGTRRI
jgi:hypothetical protein